MRWKAKLWIIVVVVASSYGQMVGIDNNLNPEITSISTNNVNESTERTTVEARSYEDTESGNEEQSNQNATEDYDNSLSSLEGKSESSQSSTQELSRETPTSVESASALEFSNERLVGDVVETKHGLVQGHNWGDSTDILGFIDIPYGSITTLFEAPSVPAPWDTTHDKIEHNVRCPQLQTVVETSTLEVTGELNCLTLSVFVPRDAQNAGVLFHIHDGNFSSGSGDPSIYGPEYLVPKGIILVLPNYRLGPLGFLCLQNETAPGNAALRDLTLALEWTKENIAAFGGNPNNIVVSGEGTSGALAGYLALSPKSRGYISKVIADSGSVISHWAIDRHPESTSDKLAEKIRNANSDVTFNDDLFFEIDMAVLLLNTYGELFRPCVDNYTDAFMTLTPWNILQEQEIHMAFMIGSASHAGLYEALSLDEGSISTLNSNFETFLPDDLIFEDSEDEKVAERVKYQYFGQEAISANHLKELSECYTDALYLGPLLRVARVLIEAGATVYFYEFAFAGGFNRELIALGEQAASVNGSARGDIVGYLFTQDGRIPDPDSEEDRIVELLSDLWVSFIETGKPTSEGVEWNVLAKTTVSEEEWLWIGSQPTLRKGIHANRLELWSEIYEAHFVERNAATSVHTPFPAFIVAAIYLLGIYKYLIKKTDA